MRLDRLKISNYKGFKETDWLHFNPGFNVVVGQNNAGKTALLECLRLRNCERRPYRGQEFPSSAPLNTASSFEADISVSGAELEMMVLRRATNLQILLPVEVSEQAQQQAFVDAAFSRSEIRLSLTASQGAQSQSKAYPSHRLFTPSAEPRCVVLFPSNDKSRVVVSGSVSGPNDTLPLVFDAEFENYIYVFKPERLNIGTCPVQDTDILSSDAGNLPAVLLKLQGNTARFNRFNQHVTTIFPSISRVVVVPSDTTNQNIDVRLWTIDPSTERVDLTIKLQESGTGIGQVLAILYVAMTRRANVIAIDEPNSFLHPGAAKKLLQILKQYGDNQYIISTHSAELILASEPSTIHLVSWNGQESVTEQLDHSSVASMKRILTDVGASLADVFGADCVVWVEGPTEQTCFPLIAKKLRGKVPPGLVFAPLRNTGDLEGKGTKTEVVWEIYERLTKGPTLLPPVIAFSFDREGRSDRQIEDMTRRSRQLVHFLPRATYENFLIHPAAIAAVLHDEFQRHDLANAPTDADVEGWLASNFGRYVRQENPDSNVRDERWLSECKAPKLLRDLFQELSGSKLAYHKLTHSIAITEWLLEHDYQCLAELSNYVAGLVLDPAGQAA